MNRKLNTHDIGRLLDRSVAQLDNSTLDKLQSARRTALQHQPVTKQAPVLAWLVQHGLIHHHPAQGHKALNIGLAALLAALLFSGALYWHQYYERDHSDIDIAILTDDLPVDMYVD